MSEDPTRATPITKDVPAHGSVGPADPHADPATTPGLRRPSDLDGPATDPRMSAVAAAPETPTAATPTVATPTAATPTGQVSTAEAPTVTAPTGTASAGESPAGNVPEARTPAPPVVTRTRTGGLWTGLIFSAIVLVFLLVFILQNLVPVTIYFLGFTLSLPIGVALLLAAIAGLLLVAIPGGLRILQLRRVARRAASR